jgi:hypothetical protein
MEKFRITIGSLPDKEQLVADIFYDNVQWAEVTQETDELIVHFYSHPRQKYWEFNLENALEILAKAKKQLLGLDIRSD